jgi:lysophospholipase L1-like esterase
MSLSQQAARCSRRASGGNLAKAAAVHASSRSPSLRSRLWLTATPMQAAISEGYRLLGANLGVAVAPAGDAWETVLRDDPTIDLWQADGSHPSPAGTYLAACALYASIFKISPVGNSDLAHLPPDVARVLQIAAGQP